MSEVGGSRDASVGLVAEVKRLESALAQREAEYHSVTTAMTEGVVFQSESGEITSINPGAERILGRPAAQILGQTSDTPWPTIREDGTPFPAEQHPAMFTLRTGEPQSNVVMGIGTPDGSIT